MSNIVKFLDLHGQYQQLRPEIDEAVQGVLEESAFIGGPRVRAFENAFAEYQQASHCVAVGNGTDALEIALEGLSLPQGSEVLVPANSFIATSEAVTRAGHFPVFCDVDPSSYLIDLADANERTTDRTRAIICVHLYGNPCDMDAIGEFAAKQDLHVVEDAAQAHGAEWRGHRVGALGRVGTFSFYPGKILGAYGDGGAIVTNDSALAERCRMIANHGRTEKYRHVIEGRNSRLDGLQAAVLNAKVPHVDRWIDLRVAAARQYLAGLDGVGDLDLPVIRSAARHVFHLFVVRTARRNELADYLGKQGIETGVHYPRALTQQEAYRSHGLADAPLTANLLGAQLLSLPMGEHLDAEDVQRVIDSVSMFFTEGPG